jgi:uncharacterized repeat protein (TIGR02543 family)
MSSQSLSKVKLILRHLILVFVCLFTLSFSVPAFAGPPTTYTVTFYENDSGTDSVSTYQLGTSAQDLTLFSNLSPAFSDSGHTFTGWNTSANGTETSFSNGESYSFSSDLALYAEWTTVPVTSTVTFYENDSGTDSVSTYQLGTSAEDLTLFSNLSPAFSDSGHTFTGWNTSANGTGTSFSNGESYSFSSDLALYAQWTATATFTANFVSNGGFGSIPSISDPAGSTVLLPSGSAMSYVGYAFAGWNTAANGSGTPYAAGSSIVLNANETFYAQWGLTSTVQIVFGVNGGSGSAATLSGVSGSMVTLPGSSSLLKSGYTLTSWNTATNGSGTSYALGESVTLSTSLTLYAQWKKTPSAVLLGAVGPFSKKSATLTSDLKAQVRHLATTIKSKKYAKVTLYGYTAETGVASLDRSLSRERALSVANYLRSELNAMKVKGVAISAAGEGAVAGKTAPQYSRVEVFVS